MTGLREKLLKLRPIIARKAQSVIDSWEQDADGFDEELGAGGACDRISSVIADVVISNVRGVDVVDGGHEGDDHAYVVVFDTKHAFAVDIPPSVYETGGGYRWTKRKNITIKPNDVIVEPVNRADVVAGLEDQ